jgi:hypothetical protein
MATDDGSFRSRRHILHCPCYGGKRHELDAYVRVFAHDYDWQAPRAKKYWRIVAAMALSILLPVVNVAMEHSKHAVHVVTNATNAKV